jgi:hypothetical protein
MQLVLAGAKPYEPAGRDAPTEFDVHHSINDRNVIGAASSHRSYATRPGEVLGKADEFPRARAAIG